MDGSRFDPWTRRRFGLFAGGTAAALFGLTAHQETEAKKKRKKKRKPKPPREICRKPREACSSSPEQQCCSGLTCDDSGCNEGAFCLQNEGGTCTDSCDCRAGLECSERDDFSCQQCSLPQGPCDTAANCCLNASFCATSECADPQYLYCCQGLGAPCTAPCDCCPNPGNCGRNGCGGVEPVCCRGLGFPCQNNCDCCDPLRCLGEDPTCQ